MCKSVCGRKQAGGHGKRLIVEIDLESLERTTMTTRKPNTKGKAIEEVAGDRDLMKTLMKEALQEVLEGEMSEFLGAERGERTPARSGYTPKLATDVAPVVTGLQRSSRRTSWNRTSMSTHRIRFGPPTSPISGRTKAGSTWRLYSTSSLDR